MKHVQLLALVMILVVAGSVAAKNSWLREFDAEYGTDRTRLSDCVICHVDTPRPINAYGTDFFDAYSGNVRQALRAIENMDSDGDGVSNLREIELNTFPGDAGDTAPTRPTTWGAIKELYK